MQLKFKSIHTESCNHKNIYIVVIVLWNIIKQCIFVYTASTLSTSSNRWTHAYHDQSYHAAINTNNGVELLNKVLQYNYNYLPRRKNWMLLSLVYTILVEELFHNDENDWL